MPLPGTGEIKCRYTDCEKLFDTFEEREQHYINAHSNRSELEKYE